MSQADISNNFDSLDDYLLTGKQEKRKRSATPPRIQAKKTINQLIDQDASSVVNLQSLSQKKPAGGRASAISLKATPKSSHLVNLRAKVAPREFERPQRESLLSKFFSKQKTNSVRNQYHVPSGSLDVQKISLDLNKSPRIDKSEEVYSEPQDYTVNLKATLAIFGIFLFVFILPIKALTLSRLASTVISSVNSNGIQALSKVLSGISAVEAADYSGAGNNFSAAEQSFSQIRDQIESYSQQLGSISSILPPVQAAEQLTEAGQQLAQVASLLTSIMEEPNANITDTVYSVRAKLAGAVNILEQAEKNLQLIPSGVIPNDQKAAFKQLQNDLPLVNEQIQRLSAMGSVLYQILGGEHLSRVLFVFQNNRELRPTGGFIGSYALIDFHRGEVSAIEFPGGGSYDVDGGMKEKIASPYALQLLSPTWHMRDANWWPDFPSSARKISSMYFQSGGPTVDAVVAVNSDVLQDLLKLVGPIDLPQYEKTLTSENVYSVLQNAVEVEYDKQENKPKQILADALPILLEKLLKYSDKLQLSQVLSSSLAQRDIQMYSFDEDLQREIVDLHWDGSQKKVTGDYLQVVSTNLGGGKSDSSINEHIDHRAEIKSDGSIEVTVTITKNHTATTGDQFANVNNVDYLRVYVPMGSKLVAAGGFTPPDSTLFATSSNSFAPDTDLQQISGTPQIDDRSGTRIYNELGHTVFANWMQIKPGTEGAVYFTYVLPFKIQLAQADGTHWLNIFSPNYNELATYSLYVQRQSGKKHSSLESSVIIDPQLKVLWSRATGNKELSVAGRLVNFVDELTSDKYFALILAHQSNSD